jgi:octaprenyl-diphosphate synthase
MAVVIELIHTATLLHVDIVDESKSRRGKETANEVWGNAASSCTLSTFDKSPPICVAA